MIVNFKDPASILAWWRINPERHGPQLKAIARLRPQFRAAIKRAAELSTESVGKGVDCLCKSGEGPAQSR